MCRLKSSWNSEFSSKIETFSPNSGRLDTLLGFLGGPPGASIPKKFRNFRSSNCWKCGKIVNPTITTLYLGHFKFFTVPSGGPFWLVRGGGGTLPFQQACSYTPNLTGKKHTISTFVDQTRILLCKGLQTKMASYAPDKKAIFSRNFLSFYFRSTSCKQVHISFQILYELW